MAREDIGHQSSGDLPVRGQCNAIDFSDESCSRFHRSFHVKGDVSDDVGLDSQLPVHEVFDQDSFEQGFIRLLDADERERA